MSKSVSKSIMANEKERARRSSLLKELWQNPEIAQHIKEAASRTAKKTSARPDILKKRSEQLKRWRQNNPNAFYDKCIKAMHNTWSSKPEKKLLKYVQDINSNFKGNQQIKSSDYFHMNKTGRKQVDILDRQNKIIIELDGPHHFKAIHGEDQLELVKLKDLALDEFCKDKKYTLIRVSHTEYDYRSSVDNFTQETLDKVKQILKNRKIGIYKIGKEYV